jgi:alpha-2-macroglobulin
MMRSSETSTSSRLITLGTIGLTALLSLAVALSDAWALPPQASRPAAPGGTIVVPDRFLRRWDPVTLFFDSDKGPAHGGPEDHPERLVVMTPQHPGAFQWLDARTLQFRPAEPWPPIARVFLAVGGSKLSLATLMPAPTDTWPTANSDETGQVNEIRLTLPEPLDAGTLRRMVSIELRPLPGVGTTQVRWLGRDDFSVKSVERQNRGDPAKYILELKNPLPLGMRVAIHFRLSLDEEVGESMAELSFSTAPPFRIAQLGCGSVRLPVTPEGVSYGKDQPLRCPAGGRALMIEFSATPKEIDPIKGRNLVQITPPVSDLAFSGSGGRSLQISGRFLPETLYKVTLAPVLLTDTSNRPLEMSAASSAFVFFPRQRPYLSAARSSGIMERLGPQNLPLEGRGQDRLDLRLYKLDPLDRSYWPFPASPILVDEAKRPPGPGEEATPWARVESIPTDELRHQIESLGSPQVSAIVVTPLKREGAGASFGLDLKPHLAKASGADRPGTYLIGIRRLDGSTERAWARLQVTDLALTTVEEPKRVRFLVTSLASGMPVPGAQVRVEGVLDDEWLTVFSGTTGKEGELIWQAPGSARHPPTLRRLSARKDDDVLVYDANSTPEGYADNQWSQSGESWLAWTQGALDGRAPQPEQLCHLFPERPVYRPEEPVHLKGYLRTRFGGELKVPKGLNGSLVVQGPGDLSWTYPVELTRYGSFYTKFSEEGLPTGNYSARFETAKGERFCHTVFKLEAYRIPEFELALNGPDKVPLDRDFEVTLTASYYAGGRVAGRPVRWRVSQFPYTWTPQNRPRFAFSSDGRFSRTTSGELSQLEREATTDDKGTASLTLNPGLEPTASPRTYAIEATVIGADDQTVSTTRSVLALPPFVLGVQVPRTVEKKKSLDAKIIVVGPDDKLLAGQRLQVRLLHRQWHSYLAAGDFSEGAAKYVTDVVDEKIYETTAQSGSTETVVPLALPKAGVYVVELEARDRLGRAQTVAVDFFNAGDEPVTWSKPTNQVFSVATDKAAYDPGDTAAVVLKSPFQNAQALAVVEAPEGNQYSWVEVKGGSAMFHLPIRGTYTPRVPVHFLLERGRVAGTGPIAATTTDLGKPATMAATAWLTVNPIDNMLEVTLDYPAKVQPGSKAAIKIQLRSAKDKKPLAGEVTLWLVDQAVLALGKEQRLDPVPDFITGVSSHLTMRDTRNDVIGFLPFAENPGGDGSGEGEGGGLLDKVTVRKNFLTVPYYNPAIEIGPSGAVTVTVQMPDNLTNFKLRAKAAAANGNRFGFGTGMISVRLPLIVQPALPRFVRPGDTFVAVGIGRVVEGPGGAGTAEIRMEGAKTTAATVKKLDWQPNAPQRIEVPVEVVTPPYDQNGKLTRTSVAFTMGVSRTADGASDAFKVSLPIKDDRDAVKSRVMADLVAGAPLNLPAISEAARAGTIRREILVSNEPGIVKMAAGLDFLLQYPHDCTEQRLSRARAMLALRKFRTLLQQRGADSNLDRGVKETVERLKSVVDGSGLVAYWPGSSGYVTLTAWSLMFLVEAEEAGFKVDASLKTQLKNSLQQAVRSDYTHFVSGEAWEERTWALSALYNAGEKAPAYLDELGRDSRYLDLEGSAELLLAYARGGQSDSTAARALGTKLIGGVIFRLYQGHEMYGGLQALHDSHNSLILPSETRTLAELTRSLFRAEGKHPRLQLLTDALVTLGRDDSWGSTNASASALLALSEVLSGAGRATETRTVSLRLDGKDSQLTVKPDQPLASMTSTSGGAVEVNAQAGKDAVLLRSELSYIPAADGSTVAATSTGFVVTREWQLVRGGDRPAEVTVLKAPGTTLSVSVLDVVEEHVQVINPKDRNYVAVVVPLAAGMEPLNPALATAPPEAMPSGRLSRPPTYAAFMDDQVTYYFDTLAKGTYDFFFRVRASVSGRFIQPPARAEMMYDMAVRGSSPGAMVEVARKEPSP